ncbi:MAG TPA: O-antigen ligase family protein [Thermoleophilaceae bacterium]|nr:O-antigen ligase family protein [Thermoleophilaceae bacterium]
MAFAAIAFIGKGGNELGAQTLIGLTLILGCGVIAAIGVTYGREGHHGRGSLLLFGLLAVLTAISIFWSIAPDLTWIEADRTFAYFAVFAAGVAAGRLAPTGYAVLLRGVLGAVAILTLYALASRIWPEQIGGPTEIYARISEPFGYWNAVGVTAALGVVPTLWLGARRSGYQSANALAYPLMALLYLAMMLSFSRGSLIATGLGALAWFAFVPLRLRSLPVLLVPAVISAPVLVWALGKDEFTKDGLPAATRAAVGPEFGLILIAMCLVLLAIGLAIGLQGRDWIPSFRLRRRTGVVAVAIALALPLMLLTSVALSSRGLPGTVSERWHELTSESASTPGGPQRLIRASSTRGRYWRQAAHVFSDLPVTGTGAGTFGIARLHYRKDQLVAQHAHGFIAQTAADLGTLGLLAIFAFAGAWFVSAARTTGLERHPKRREGAPKHWDADRVGTTALALAALTYAFQSAIDWTWFVPGPTVMALVLAGYVAGRGPAPQPAGMPSSIIAAGPSRHQRVALPRLPKFRLRLPPRPHAVRLIPALLVIVVAVCAAWAVYQPQRSDQANQQALDLLANKQLPAADKQADKAHSIDPASVSPLWTKAAIAIAAGKLPDAEVQFQRAVFDQPSNPEAWTRLAEFEVYRNNQPRKALDVIKGALYLDPRSAPAQTVFFDALRTIRNEP